MVAVVAAGVAIWSAMLARGARNAAVDQARTAQEALDLQKAQQHHADRPQFRVETLDPEPGAGPATFVTMISGPVRVKASIDSSRTILWWTPVDGHQIREELQTSHQTMLKGRSCVITGGPHDMAQAMVGLIKIECVEDGGAGRQWVHEEAIDWRLPRPE